jgi:hypothetical protein
MIIKINTHKIEHQTNITMFVGDYDNLIERKTKQVIKFNSQSTKCWKMKLKKINKKNSILNNKIEKK